MVTIDTILDDLAAGCTVWETYTDAEVLKARQGTGRPVVTIPAGGVTVDDEVIRRHAAKVIDVATAGLDLHR